MATATRSVGIASEIYRRSRNKTSEIGRCCFAPPSNNNNNFRLPSVHTPQWAPYAYMEPGTRVPDKAMPTEYGVHVG